MSSLDDFLALCADEIDRRAATARSGRSVFESGARAFRDALDTATPVEHDPTEVPLTACLDELAAALLVPSLLAARDELRWVASPRAADGGRERALAPLNDVLDLGTTTCGLMLVGPGCSYPEHGHPPQEIYLPISGDGLWRFGGDPRYRPLGRDELVYNPPSNTHGAVAGDDPLLALYVLWSSPSARTRGGGAQRGKRMRGPASAQSWWLRT